MDLKEIGQNQPIILISLDGLGMGPESEANVFNAETAPYLSGLIESYPSTRLSAKASDFGWPEKTITTSEIGHLTLTTGADCIYGSESLRVMIDDGIFFKDHNLLSAVKQSKQNNTDWHLIGLIDDEDNNNFLYLSSLLDYVNRKKINQVYLHLIFAQSDEEKCLASLKKVTDLIEDVDNVVIASVIGADYAMNEKYQWKKTTEVYRLLFGEPATIAKNPWKVLKKASERGLLGGLIKPTACQVGHNQVAAIKDNDVVVFFNDQTGSFFQLASALTEKKFDKFQRSSSFGVLYLSLDKFPSHLPIKTISHKTAQINLATVLAKNNLSQIVVTEAEGVLSACYIANNFANQPIAKQDWKIVNSPLLSELASQPLSATTEIINEAIVLINTGEYDFVNISIPALDLVGRTGGYKLLKECLIELDKCLAKLIKVGLEKDNLIFITSCCSRSEQAVDLVSGEDNFLNTNGDVPFVAIGNQLEGVRLVKNEGERVNSLLDIAPTILKHFNIDQPSHMTGKSLL